MNYYELEKWLTMMIDGIGVEHDVGGDNIMMMMMVIIIKDSIQY